MGLFSSFSSVSLLLHVGILIVASIVMSVKRIIGKLRNA